MQKDLIIRFQKEYLREFGEEISFREAFEKLIDLKKIVQIIISEPDKLEEGDENAKPQVEI